ncbi:hypothetical protein [Robertmurraya sp.]|uniref:hypothetical protein n=1 Tax=Robertmurraya sp. TaxID=2837525 RepID=UPI003704952E
MTTKQEYQNILTEVNAIGQSVITLDSNLTTIDNSDLVTDDVANILMSITDIQNWANAAIEQAIQEEQNAVMNNFLAELKVVFDRYAAKIEIGSDTTGYGEAYGTGETAVGIKLTATFEGTTATKEINKSVIIGSDLV